MAAFRASDCAIKKASEISDAFSFLTKGYRLFSVDDGFVDSVPTSSIQTPVVRGVLVALNSHFSSLDFFVSINTHNTL